MRAVALLAIAAVACSPSTRTLQIQTANAVATAANAAGPLIVAEYQKEGDACIDNAATMLVADVCLTKLESKWVHVRLGWGHMRQAQADWADALKKSDPKIADYMTYMTQAFCALRQDVPTLPAVPGLVCPATSTAP